ncbi:LTA synthase family protein [Pseudochrobactrum sp. XF203]|uniref:LTA synthase family protein n=1 Tax=Pseudochrobactrum sp. XF203 TaxID=2879116 RepID=UPI001CE388B6|nr:LTA synthase family protein [Pseudochrobactrum sp. XF203]UCA45869.1 LTA synthase family protein [Pseudochrobactrum sp. XF203]
MSNLATPVPHHAPHTVPYSDSALNHGDKRNAARRDGRFCAYFARRHWFWRALIATAGTLFLTLSVVMLTEWLMRGSAASWKQYFTLTHRPLWTTLGLVFLTLFLLDSLLGRLWQGILIVAPVLLGLAWFSRQKGMYLGDPLYPSDLLYTRQVVDLMPLLVRDRPLDAVLIVLASMAALAALYFCWRFFRRSVPRLSWTARAARLAVAMPALIWFGSISDYSSFSYIRDRMGIVPMMWDQKENYAHNGLVVAFIFNIPMANVSAPNGYSQERIASIAEYLFPADDDSGLLGGSSSAHGNTIVPVAARNDEKPDVIVIMSESFWDPSRLPGVAFDEDPIKNVRANQSGHVFSPEFGGMTANVEFEALTGFSNAFLPYGSIPYQQYVRRPVPSLASFFSEQGYETRALHPYRQWFWNRGSVYENFGFDKFLSEENLPELMKKGHLASDEEFTSEIIRSAEEAEKPLFLFGVSLQGHGPYAPSRYPDSQIKVVTNADSAVSEASKGSVRSFAQGAQDADINLGRLMAWAKKRERETIIVFFGDHLPPLGDVYVESGYMKNRTASRVDTADHMLAQHETPLVLWSSRTDSLRGVGTISPSFLPLYVLEMAGLQHPYYTGFLGKVHQEYSVIDGHLLLDKDYTPHAGWMQQPVMPQILQDYRQVQYDMMFGNSYSKEKMFPFISAGIYATTGQDNKKQVTSQY